MAHLIDKNALVAEIEKRKMCLVPKMTFQHQRGEFEHLLSFINSMQEVPVSEDLEEVANKYGKDTFVNECMENGVCDYNDLTDAFKAGALWKEQQMLKKSFGATVCKYLNTYLKEMDRDAISQVLKEYTNGDRVRVAIIKQE